MANLAQRSFAAGEVAPALYPRTDLARHRESLRALRNYTVAREGGAESRPGFEYLGRMKLATSSELTDPPAFQRLIPLEFDDDSTFVVEVGYGYLRFWKDGAQVVADMILTWTTATAYAVGDVASVSGDSYIALSAHTSASTTQPGVGATWTTVWYLLEGGTIELPTPYTDRATIREVQVAYELNVVTLVHRDHAPRRLTRYSDDHWEFGVAAFVSNDELVADVAVSGTAGADWGYSVFAVFDGAGGVGDRLGPRPPTFVRTNDTSPHLTTYKIARAISSRTITWTAVPGAREYYVCLNKGASELVYLASVGNVTSYVDNGLAWAVGGFSGTWASWQFLADNSIPLFSTAGDYPGVIGAFQQRLLFTGSADAPDVVRGSKQSDTRSFDQGDPIVDSDAVNWRQVGRRVVRNRHLVECNERLWQLMNVGEGIIQGDRDNILRPGEVNPRMFSENGAATYPEPLVLDDALLYVQAAGSRVRDIVTGGNGLAGSDLTIAASHLVKDYTIVSWALQRSPDPIVWAVRNDGVMLSCTYVREDGQAAWARHDTGLSYTIPEGELLSHDYFLSVCVVEEAGRDRVYAVVWRTIEAAGARTFLERLSEFIDPATRTVAATDSAVVLDGDSPAPMDHLRGRFVSVRRLSDGAVLASPMNPAYPLALVSVDTGALNTAFSDIYIEAGELYEVGIPFVTDLQTLEVDSDGRSLMPGAFSCTKLGLWLQNTRQLWAGQRRPASDGALSDGSYDLQPVPLLDEDGEPAPVGADGRPLVGYFEVDIEGAFTKGGSILLRNVDPVPSAILAVVIQGHFPRG